MVSLRVASHWGRSQAWPSSAMKSIGSGRSGIAAGGGRGVAASGWGSAGSGVFSDICWSPALALGKTGVVLVGARGALRRVWPVFQVVETFGELSLIVDTAC